ncbi:MAG: hypothetical protein QW520_01030 [Methanomassiliicoccales archaeon]
MDVFPPSHDARHEFIFPQGVESEVEYRIGTNFIRTDEVASRGFVNEEMDKFGIIFLHHLKYSKENQIHKVRG